MANESDIWSEVCSVFGRRNVFFMNTKWGGGTHCHHTFIRYCFRQSSADGYIWPWWIYSILKDIFNLDGYINSWRIYLNGYIRFWWISSILKDIFDPAGYIRSFCQITFNFPYVLAECQFRCWVRPFSGYYWQLNTSADPFHMFDQSLFIPFKLFTLAECQNHKIKIGFPTIPYITTILQISTQFMVFSIILRILIGFTS